MCEKKECLKGKKEMCSCEAVKSGYLLLLLLHVRENMRDMEWEFEYTTLSCPEPRRLCAGGSCRQCGGRLFISIGLDDTLFGEKLLAEAYRGLELYEGNMSCKGSDPFRERFIGMFHEQDRAFVHEWLEQREKQSVETTHRNNRQAVQIYTIIRSGADADRGIFTNPYPECSFLSHERAREELARLIEEEKDKLNESLDTIDEGEDYWEASEDGYAAAHFTRLEIVASELADSIGGV